MPAPKPKPHAPRAVVKLGKAKVNSSYIKTLRSAWRHRELVLFLGAGVSVPYGLLSWQDLVLELLFEQAKNTRRLGRLWPHYRRAVAAWMTDYFGYDPLVLARMVEHHAEERNARSGDPAPPHQAFVENLRSHLYSNLLPAPPNGTLLQAIANLAKRGTAKSGLAGIVTFNFDDLLEEELEQRGVEYCVVAGRRRPRHRGLRVVHPHGYVPRIGALSRPDVVFTEPDYHRLTEEVFHWGLSEIVDHLRKRTVLFIGLSMSDPSLRRLLDASRNEDDIPPHYQIQKRHEIRDHEVREVMRDIERRARNYSAGRRFGSVRKPPAELVEIVHAALAQADTYDSEVYETMGVKTIWVDEFPHITDIVKAIPRR